MLVGEVGLVGAVAGGVARAGGFGMINFPVITMTGSPLLDFSIIWTTRLHITIDDDPWHLVCYR